MGFATVRGGATSHVAILARSLGLPALAGIEPAALVTCRTERSVILDGNKGTLQLHPAATGRRRPHPAGAGTLRTTPREGAPRARARARQVTLDGHAHRSARQHRRPEGCGTDRGVSAAKAWACCARSSCSWNVPTRRPKNSSSKSYKAIAEVLGGQPLIIRTLDVGGDKPLAYLPIPKEDNPFLGERGIRVGLDRPKFSAHSCAHFSRLPSSGNCASCFR